MIVIMVFLSLILAHQALMSLLHVLLFACLVLVPPDQRKRSPAHVLAGAGWHALVAVATRELILMCWEVAQ